MTSGHMFPARLFSRLTVISSLGALAAALVVAPSVSPLAAALHIGLASSVPAKDAHLMTAPTEIRLTFTGKVDVAKAGLELLGPGGTPVATDPLRAVADSDRVAVAKITAQMPGGSYTVKWRAVAADGAEGSGSFTFMYMAPEESRESTFDRAR